VSEFGPVDALEERVYLNLGHAVEAQPFAGVAHESFYEVRGDGAQTGVLRDHEGVTPIGN
jgi:hypothetical protein